MKTELLNHRILLAAVVICGLLASLTLTSTESHAFDLTVIGKDAPSDLIETDPASIPGIAPEQAERTVPPKVPTLGCCQCLGGTNTLDLSTISSNNWIVTDPNAVSSPVAFVSPINGLWNLNPGLAQWVSTSSNAGFNNLPPGFYQYSLYFLVPVGAIQQSVNLAGTCGGDDTISVYLDSTSSANLLTSCTSGSCFNLSNPPQPFSCVVAPGLHTLIVIVHNFGGPTGMFVNVKLTGTCVSLFCRG